ncbi:MAG: hypothetical protein J2P46_08545 [Zavarzinella sp.]|nr:hypothetical protein [Zavarzinella sp.]
MASRVQRNGRTPRAGDDGVEALYHEFLDAFYRNGNRERALALAPRLEAAVLAAPAAGESIRAEEIRSLIAELNGDFVAAARSREAEIRKILELHTLAVNTPNWPAVSRQYDFTDVSDRLDLLAVLYDRQGDTDWAVAVLHESRRYCEAHGVPFDGADILNELERARRPAKRAAGARKRSPAIPAAKRATARRTKT